MAVARRLLLLVAVACAAVVPACAALFDFGELPLRTAADAGPDAPLDGAAPPLDCDASFRKCACELHDFCDDFDDASTTRVGAGWSGIDEIENPFVKGDAGILLTDQAWSEPRGLTTTSTGDRASSFALLTHQMSHDRAQPGRDLGGVRITLRVRVRALSLLEVRGPLDAGSAIVTGMARLEKSALRGITLLAAEEGIFLHASENLLDVPADAATRTDVILPVYDAPVSDLLGNWVRMEILVATRVIAERAGYGSCGASGAAPGAPVMAASAGPTAKQGCAPLPAFFGGLSWASQPIIAAGAALFGGGAITLDQDDVTLDFLEP